MKARQVGVPLRSMMELAADETLTNIITEAYSTPAFRTLINQDMAIREFEDKWYLKCIKAYNQ